MATSPASMPLHIMLGSGFSPRTIHIHNVASESSGSAGQHRVDGDDGDTKIAFRPVSIQD